MRREPVLLEAVHLTIRTVHTRARLYRSAVVSVAASLAVPVLLALAARSWRPLLLVALAVPAAGVFLVLDGRTVLDWQRRVMAMWLHHRLDLGEHRRTLQALRHLPASTVRGMLDRLPACGCPPPPGLSLPAERTALFETCIARARRQERRTLLAMAAAAILACAAPAATLVGTGAVLLGAPAGLLLLAWSRR